MSDGAQMYAPDYLRSLKNETLTDIATMIEQQIKTHNQTVYELDKAVSDRVAVELERDNLKHRIKKAKELPKIHYDSTTPMEPYFTGMYNGIECVLACIEGREPHYKDVEKIPERNL